MALTNGVYRGKKLTLTINSIDYTVDATSILITSEDLDKDALTYAAYAAGGKQWYMNITGVQDLATNTLWNYVWTASGTTGVAFKLKLYGNASATGTQPYVTGTLTIGDKPDISGDPSAVFKFTTRFDIDGVPTLQTSGT